MNRKSKIIMQLFILLFSMSVSVSVLPCNYIHVHGLFGEVTDAVVKEDTTVERSDIVQRNQKKLARMKGVNIYNILFVIMMLIVCIIFRTKRIRLPRTDTIVTMKIRMNN